MQLPGQLADVVTERLRPVVDDVVDLAAPAAVERIGRRLRDIADVNPRHDPLAGHGGHRPQLREPSEHLGVWHIGTVEDAVAQHDSLGVAVFTGCQDRLLHAPQRRKHLGAAGRRRTGIRVGLVHLRGPRRRVAVGEDHRFGDDPAHACALRRGDKVRCPAAPQCARRFKVLDPHGSPFRQRGQQADHHLGFDVGDYGVDLAGVEDIGHHRFGARLFDLRRLRRLRRLAGQADDIVATGIQLP